MLSEKTRAMLMELGDFLEAMPRTRFYYGHWVAMDWGGLADLSCGTTACAAGWATTLPSYQDAGLYLYRPNRYASGSVACDVGGSRIQDEEALSYVLDIDIGDATLLFVPTYHSRELDMVAPSSGATPAEVAAHIRKYLVRRIELDSMAEAENGS